MSMTETPHRRRHPDRGVRAVSAIETMAAGTPIAVLTR